MPPTQAPRTASPIVTTPGARWLRRPRPRRDPAVRLLCLPHAGGSTSLYRGWAGLLPSAIEPVLVCPPGREDRLDEPLPQDLDELVTGLAQAASGLLDRPWAVFGHSMGATVGHELVLRLMKDGHRAPEHLFVSAREAPQYHRGGTVHLLDEDALSAELVRLGGTPPELLEMPEVRQLVLPVVRGDYRLIETYQAEPAGLVPCPVTAFIGAQDDEVTAEEATGWERWTTGPFQLLTFPGGHFYLSGRPDAVVDGVRRRLLTRG
ncbi:MULTISPECIES: thioesterase domain-containing protein [unclassified Streptomyces]|uniref:thioesterase II family protein n=1 Tax=unclassified Streptomyces TaxID=2593676 RepID=UPI0007C5DAA8|nr:MULTISPECIES: thioesterase domain-containing protein [unclassified Streptomyces]MYT32278.1 alpha/beta fold hydrolase [Streptomyces sp. SID8354]